MTFINIRPQKTDKVLKTRQADGYSIEQRGWCIILNGKVVEDGFASEGEATRHFLDKYAGRAGGRSVVPIQVVSMRGGYLE